MSEDFDHCTSCNLKGQLNTFCDCFICKKKYCPHCCYVGKYFVLEIGHCECHLDFLKQMKIKNWDEWCKENDIDMNDQIILNELKNDWEKFEKKFL